MITSKAKNQLILKFIPYSHSRQARPFGTALFEKNSKKKNQKDIDFSLWSNHATTRTNIIYCTIFPSLAPCAYFVFESYGNFWEFGIYQRALNQLE